MEAELFELFKVFHSVGDAAPPVLFYGASSVVDTQGVEIRAFLDQLFDGLLLSLWQFDHQLLNFLRLGLLQQVTQVEYAGI